MSNKSTSLLLFLQCKRFERRHAEEVEYGVGSGVHGDADDESDVPGVPVHKGMTILFQIGVLLIYPASHEVDVVDEDWEVIKEVNEGEDDDRYSRIVVLLRASRSQLFQLVQLEDDHEAAKKDRKDWQCHLHSADYRQEHPVVSTKKTVVHIRSVLEMSVISENGNQPGENELRHVTRENHHSDGPVKVDKRIKQGQESGDAEAPN